MTRQPCRILIIHSDPRALLTLCNRLRLGGFDVTTAQVARRALDVIDAPSYDVVLVAVPFVGGGEVDLLYRIHTLQSDARIVMLAQLTSDEASRGAVILDAAIHKRVSEDIVKRAIYTALGVRRFVSNGNNHEPRMLSTNPAARRWAAVVGDVLSASEDVPTVSAWSKMTARSCGTIKMWCANAGVSAGDSLDFARLLRAIRDHEGQQWDLLNILDVADRRTLVRLCDRAGLSRDVLIKAPLVDIFMSTQRLVSSPTLLSATQNLMADE
jgi:DNA-binding NarL/FixJ family response regulator